MSICSRHNTSKCPGAYAQCEKFCSVFQAINVLDKVREEPPIARNTDPESSHIAAKDIKDSGRQMMQQIECLYLVREFPGLTSRELAEKKGADRYMFSRRLPELERNGMVERARNPDGSFLLRVCNVGGKKSCVWFPKGVDGQ